MLISYLCQQKCGCAVSLLSYISLSNVKLRESRGGNGMLCTCCLLRFSSNHFLAQLMSTLLNHLYITIELVFFGTACLFCPLLLMGWICSWLNSLFFFHRARPGASLCYVLCLFLGSAIWHHNRGDSFWNPPALPHRQTSNRGWLVFNSLSQVQAGFGEDCSLRPENNTWQLYIAYHRINSLLLVSALTNWALLRGKQERIDLGIAISGCQHLYIT